MNKRRIVKCIEFDFTYKIKILMNTYITYLINDIDRVLALPRISGYEKAIRPWIMKGFKEYLNGKKKYCRKEDQWNALSEIARLYGMVVKFNNFTKLAYIHIGKAPICYEGEHPCTFTYHGTFPIKETEHNLFECINQTKKVFIERYKDMPLFQKAIASLS